MSMFKEQVLQLFNNFLIKFGLFSIILTKITESIWAILDDDVTIKRIAAIGVILGVGTAFFGFMLALRKSFIKIVQDYRSKKSKKPLRE